MRVAGEGVETGESRRKDHAGVVAKFIGQAPTLRKPGAEVGGLVVQDQWDAGVAQRIQACRNRHAGGVLQCEGPLGVDAELRHGVEGSGAARQLDDVSVGVNGLEVAAPIGLLDETGDVLVQDGGSYLRRDEADALVAV